MAEILEKIATLPDAWPFAGSLRLNVLRRIAELAAARPVRASAETGTGKSTLLLSHLSAHHTAFTLDDAGAGDSLRVVRESPLLRREAVEFVVGPTQQTLPRHRFAGALDLALIDGPHGFPFAQLEYYFLYPLLAPGALLIVDDVHIRAVNDLFRVLRADAMFELVDVVRTTAFFRRTAAPTLDPLGDGWWLQGYNLAWLPLPAGLPLLEKLKSLVPWPLKERLRALRASYVPAADRAGRSS
jgi:predicted O-methyltransferase YrrM